jgi:redox-sensitive bicupin YhaK (pirin superfamily)
MVSIVRPLRTPQGNLVSPIGEGGVSPMAPDARARTVGPFMVVAHYDSTFAPGEAPLDLDVRPHPHIGIATLSYLFSGAITHRDGLGNVSEVLPGDVAWMVAGRGIVHSERMPTLRERGGRFHGLQIWVALPEPEEECEPSFEVVRAADVRVSEASGVRERQLLGAVTRPRAPGAPWLSDVELARGAAFEAPASAEGALHVIEGSLEIEGRTLNAGETAIFGESDARLFLAGQHVRAIAFGGDAVGPRYLWWNYVHSSKERIEQAKAQWLEKRFALPADDRDDIIPLPADHERPLRILNAR